VLHAELAQQSAIGARVVIEGADHYSFLLNPAHAEMAAAEIDRFVQQLR
jgi:hypothetical protein